jgi:hypothetical protein
VPHCRFSGGLLLGDRLVYNQALEDPFERFSIDEA